jgi:DNA topoisomerase VI subunit B
MPVKTGDKHVLDAKATPVGQSKGPIEKVKSRGCRGKKKQANSTDVKLLRTTFQTSREMDFFSERELVTQTGHEIGEWPFVIVKELVDNALDACEEADVAPFIEITADACGITVKDNGPGLPEKTLKGALNFSVRASNRESYVSPCRGAQGNALKTLLAMPLVVDSEAGRLIIEAHGKRHVITCRADPISQRAVVHDDVTETAKSNNRQNVNRTIKQAFSCGTSMRIEWSQRADAGGNMLWPFNELQPLRHAEWGEDSFQEGLLQLVEGFVLFNPHATFLLDWFGTKANWEATNPTWPKWKPSDPTSPHWYELAHLERQIGAYITHDREAGTDRLVSDLVAEFDGLRGSGKRTKVLEAAGLKRAKLSDLGSRGQLDSARIGNLLTAMQQHSRVIKSERLGVIGEGNLRKRLLAMGVKPESFRYSRKIATAEKVKTVGSRRNEIACFIPWVLESAFGWLGEEAGDNRRIYTGANWSAAIKNPFRSFGNTCEGLETILADMRVTRYEPIVFVLHLAHPRIEYTDRGKSAVVIAG